MEDKDGELKVSKFIVRLFPNTAPFPYYLRGKVWTSEQELATIYTSREEALTARLSAKHFMLGQARAWAQSEVIEIYRNIGELKWFF